MNILLFSFSVALVSSSVLFQLTMFSLKNLIDKILAFMILFTANIVLITLILSELYFISISGYLISQIITAIFSLAVLLKFGSSSRCLRQDNQPNGQTSYGKDQSTGWLLKGFFVSIVIIALINLFLALYVPANAWDSMTYHLSRVGHWLQNGTLHHYYSQDFRQTSMPPNTEILFLWSISFLKNDILVNVFSWFLYLGIGLSVYRISEILGYGKRAAMFSSLVFLSLPYVILASSSSKNDLMVAFFSITSFYFFYDGCKSRDYKKLLLSGIAVGIAVGTKGTFFYLAPWIFIASLIVLFYFKTGLRLYLKWIVFCVVGVILFGAYNNVLNYKSYGNPFAPKSAIKWFHKKVTPGKIVANAARYGYEALDFRSLPEPLAKELNLLKESFGKRYLLSNPLFQKYNQGKSVKFRIKSRRSYSLGYAWFGFLGFFLYLPIVLLFFFQIIYKKKLAYNRWVFAFIAVFYFISSCAIMNYAHNRGGKILLSVIFIAPLISSIFNIKRKSLQIVVIALIMSISIYTSLRVTGSNNLRLMTGPNNIFSKDYYHKRVHKFKRVVPFMRFIEEVTQKGSRIGHVVTFMDWDYLFFGRDFSRIVIPIRKAELKKGEMEVLKKYDLDFLIIRKNKKNGIISYNPIFPAVQKEAVFHVIPGKSWNETLKERFKLDRAHPGFDAAGIIDIFNSCLNSNAPLDILLEQVSEKGSIEKREGGC